jgi:hypothetical protein
LTCISSWYICIPNIIWFHLTINKTMNENSFSKSFLSPRAITPSIIIGSYPYSNLTYISSCYICVPNIIWIHPTITEKMNGNCHYSILVQVRGTIPNTKKHRFFPILRLTRCVMKHKCPCTRQIPEVAIIVKTQGQGFKI